MTGGSKPLFFERNKAKKACPAKASQDRDHQGMNLFMTDMGRETL